MVCLFAVFTSVWLPVYWSLGRFFFNPKNWSIPDLRPLVVASWLTLILLFIRSNCKRSWDGKVKGVIRGEDIVE